MWFKRLICAFFGHNDVRIIERTDKTVISECGRCFLQEAIIVYKER